LNNYSHMRFLPFLLVLCSFSLMGHADEIRDALNQNKSQENQQWIDETIAKAHQNYPHDLKKVKEYGENALQKALEVGYKKGIGDSYFILAKTSHKLNDSDLALDYYFRAIEHFNAIGLQKELGQTFNNVGIIYKNKGKLELASDYYHKAIDIFEEIDDQSGVSKSLMNLGIIQRKQGDYEKALYSYFKALTIKESIEDKKGIALIYTNLGNLFKDQGDYDKALEYHKKSLQVLEELEDKHNTATVLNNLGVIYEKQEKYFLALDYYQKSYAISKELNSKKGIGFSLNNIGSIYDHLDDPESALKYYEEALQNLTEIDQKILMAEVYLDIGVLHKKYKRYDEAHFNLQKSLTLTREIGDKTKELKCLFSLSEFYEETNEYSQSLTYINKYTSLKDNMYSIEKNRQIAEIETKYKADKKESENAMLTSLIKGKEKENTFQFGTFILGIFSIYFFILFRQNQRANQLLDQKQNEILELNQALRQSRVQFNNANQDLLRLNDGLEGMVQKQTSELNLSNQELDNLISHYSQDLQRPLINVLALVQLAKSSRFDNDDLYKKIENLTNNMDGILKELTSSKQSSQAKRKPREIS